MGRVWLRLLGIASLALAACAQPPDERTEKPGNDVAYVGDAVCMGCHSVEAAHWQRTVHARAFTANPRTELEKHTCESCHGPGGKHVGDPNPSTIVSFTRNSSYAPEAMNAMCLECHRAGATLYWIGSTHELRGLACSDCHNPMAETSGQSLLRAKNANETCFTCHPQQRADFQKRSHMPLLEGKISCVDCHNPHGSQTAPLIKADDVNQLCTGCHAEKRGPFLWEHQPVRESCLNCHKPHGSNHERLLITELPLLCQECHSPIDNPNFGHPSALVTQQNMATSGAPDDRLMNRGCLNCHSQIHGSNSPSGPRFHR
jgi:DmsE family decaheme c-type cytochrome